MYWLIILIFVIPFILICIAIHRMSREEQYLNIFAIFFRLETCQLARGEMSLRDLYMKKSSKCLLLFFLYTYDSINESNYHIHHILVR